MPSANNSNNPEQAEILRNQLSLLFTIIFKPGDIANIRIVRNENTSDDDAILNVFVPLFMAGDEQIASDMEMQALLSIIQEFNSSHNIY